MSETETEKTIESVVKASLCTGCGTCVGICPQDAIELAIDHRKGIYVPKLDKERCTECGLCFDVCPGHSVDFKQLNLNIFGKEPEDILLGTYLNCYIGHATDYDIRYNSASGGLVTALLIFALEEGIIDGALVTRMKKDKPLEPEPFIARTREEVVSASKSKYCPVPANVALKEILKAKEGEKFAVVGLPCHIHGVRKAEAVNKKLESKVVLHLGLFCNHTPSFIATKYILHKMKVKTEDIEVLNYRGGGVGVTMRINLKDGNCLSIPEYWNSSSFGSLFYPKRCMLCYDQNCELADISFGDAWLRELKGEQIGKSLIGSRTKVGEKLLQKALAKKRIEITIITENQVIQAQRGSLYRKKSVKARMSLFELLRKETPAYNPVVPKPRAVAYPQGALCYIGAYFSSKRHLWGLLHIADSIKSLFMSLLRFVVYRILPPRLRERILG
ncbi:Ferredoxin-type protein NapF [subsurface metagenome]|nr:4Fe-4S dicluster domain-containing protein [Dehalococcoidia bacterium]